MKEFIEKLIGRLEEQIFSAELYNDEFDGQTVDNIICLGDVADTVNQLAEEYNNGWISVDDRLPEENGKYIVYYRKWTDGNYLPKFDETEIRILRYRNDGWIFPTYGDTEAEKDSHREVIGWMPLPEPYKQNGE